MNIATKYFCVLTCLISAYNLSAQTELDKRTYIEKYAPLAIEQQAEYNIPASITLAQGILESGSGKSRLAVEANNHFGIKCKEEWTGGKIYHDDDASQECFRAYKSAQESFTDHSLFLTTRPRYAKLFKLDITDYKGWAYGLKEAGYATNPVYAESLIKIIDDYNLYDFDTPEEIVETPKEKPTRERNEAELAAIDNMSFNKKALDIEQISNPAIPDKDGINVDNYTVALFTIGRYAIRCNNNCRYVIAQEDNSLSDISQVTGISERRLKKLNDLSSQENIKKGDIVYLDPKQDFYAATSFHIAKNGETMHDVAQYYAIKLSKLKTLNKAQKTPLSEGDQITLCQTN